MPAAYETLVALLVGEDPATRPFSSENAFDRALADLDDRGLVGWDRRANRYDLHPIVRGVVWSGADESDRQAIAERMRAHFEPMPAMEGEKVERLEDLTPAIELYVSLIRLGQFDNAFIVFRTRLHDSTFQRLSASRQRVELLEMLFPDGVEQHPQLRSAWDQSSTLNALGVGYSACGQPDRAVLCFRRSVAVQKQHGVMESRPARLNNLSGALLLTGALRAAEAAAVCASGLAREPFEESASLKSIGLVGVARGRFEREQALHRSLEIRLGIPHFDGAGRVSSVLAQSALWRDQPATARLLADRACEWAGVHRLERDFIHAARLQGEAALALGDLDRADERLHHALTRARAVYYVEEELAALTAVAALHLRRGNTARAREHLDAVWHAAERGPYRLLHADARNLLTEIEILEGNRDAAVAAATAAYKLAWCDGPPFAYDYGLRTARAHLQALGAPEPELPPYDPAKHEPIDEIPIEPEGEQPS
jgi:tetratricopeptide (TPR) repeat protein